MQHGIYLHTNQHQGQTWWWSEIESNVTQSYVTISRFCHASRTIYKISCITKVGVSWVRKPDSWVSPKKFRQHPCSCQDVTVDQHKPHYRNPWRVWVMFLKKATNKTFSSSGCFCGAPSSPSGASNSEKDRCRSCSFTWRPDKVPGPHHPRRRYVPDLCIAKSLLTNQNLPRLHFSHDYLGYWNLCGILWKRNLSGEHVRERSLWQKLWKVQRKEGRSF